MDILKKLEKLLPEASWNPMRAKGGAGSVTVTWELCDPKDDSGDTCEDIEFDIEYYYTPEEWEGGHIFVQENVEPEEVKFSQNAMFMGKKYRYGQTFPKQLQKYVMDFVEPMPSSLKSKFKGRFGWDAFLQYTVDKKLGR